MRKVCFVAALLTFALLTIAAHADCTQVGPVDNGSCQTQQAGTSADSPPAQQNTADTQASERAFFDLINKERTSRGMGALVYNPVLTDIARRHAMRMAESQHIYHNTSELESSQTQRRLGNPYMIGENVGVGPSTQWLHDEFMRSTEHRENILERRYTAMGIGVVISDGSLWVTQDYMAGGRAVRGAAPPRVSAGALRRALAPVLSGADAPPPADIVIIAPHEQPQQQQIVSALMLPPIPAPAPLSSPGRRSRGPLLPLAVLATLSAVGFASRRDAGAWI